MSMLSDFLRRNTPEGRVYTSLERRSAADDAAVNARLDQLAVAPSTEEATAEARPLLDAINAPAAFRRPVVRENTFAGDAEAGFGLSGRAVQNVERALGDFDAGVESQRQSAIRDAMAAISGRRQAAASDLLARENLKATKEANKRRKFLGIF